MIAYNGQLIGGGSLIAANVILTSAQRLKQIYNPSADNSGIKVIVGAHDITRTESSKRVYRVNQIIFHPQFGYNTPRDYDFALIELKPLADSSLPKERPVCLPRSDTPYSVGSAVIGAGWGRTSTSSSGSNTLRKVQLYLSDRRRCTQLYQYSVTNSMICAIDDNKDMCLGDNGGPDNRVNIVGVVSWGIGMFK